MVMWRPVMSTGGRSCFYNIFDAWLFFKSKLFLFITRRSSVSIKTHSISKIQILNTPAMSLNLERNVF